MTFLQLRPLSDTELRCPKGIRQGSRKPRLGDLTPMFSLSEGQRQEYRPRTATCMAFDNRLPVGTGVNDTCFAFYTGLWPGSVVMGGSRQSPVVELL